MMFRFPIIAVALFLAACAARPIQNVDNHPVPYSAQKLSVTEIGNEIAEAAIARGWMVDKKADGHLVATLIKPTAYEAVIDLKYSQTSYSIVYNTSRGLLDSQGNIHHNYGKWVILLDRDIQERLSLAAFRKK
ncbi:hypothetical protein [Shumkonia mesophila]|uniref:hypothetical protein n=1 Tax=Shumkonia mesophila TaxID=2838854 RepID=UPI002934BADA|nr:hypothetical protein [Shumkonia mesophila]